MNTTPTRRLSSQRDAARHFQVTERTIVNWLGKGYVKGYRTGPRMVLVDINEIERMLAAMPRAKARDGRRIYGPNAQIVNLSGVVLPEVAE